jgi:hypothetical protein
MSEPVIGARNDRSKPIRSRLLIVLGALVLGPLATPARGADSKLHVDVKKVPGTTATLAKLDGEIDVPLAALQAVLCNLEGHTEFSDVTERVAVVTPEQAKEFEAAKPSDRDEIEPYVIPKRHSATCPGRTYVLTLMDFPFPIGDGWSLAVYDAASTEGTFRMKFDTVIGSDKGAGEYTATALSESRSRLVMEYNIDLGLPLPGFLLNYAVKTQLPGQFRAIAQEATKVAETSRQTEP